MKLSREVKIGAMAMVAIGLLIFGYNFMKGQNIFDSSKEVYAVYDDVEGLSSSSEVSINGLKVGKVSKIEFLDERGKILVTMRIEKDFNFSKNSVAQIYSNGLIGGKVMKILPDYKGPELQAGDTLQSDIEMGVMANVVSRLGPLREKLESSMTGIDSLIVSVNNILDKDSQSRIRNSIASLDSIMSNFENASREISGLMTRNSSSIDHTISNFEKTAANLEQLSDSLSLVQVSPLVDKTNTILDDFNAISSKLNHGEGTAGKLLNDDEIYNNLDSATRQLEELIQDIKLNPGRYVNLKFSIFGGKKYAQPYQKPEDRSL